MKKILTSSLLLLKLVINCQVPNYVPTASLMAWYPFTGNTNDFSGNNNHCTNFYGAILSNDRFNSASCSYSLNGSSQWINTNTNYLNPNLPHTISIWWKTTDSTKINQTLFNTNPHTCENFAFHYHSSNPTPPYGMSFGLGNGVPGSWSLINPDNGQYSVNPNFNIWHHSVWVRTSNNWMFYQDGQAVYTYSANLTTTTNANLRFGAENNGFPTGGANFKGLLDDIGVWQRALSACEIYQLYTANIPSISISSSSSSICLGQSATISASGASSYTWSNGFYTPTIIVTPSVTSNFSVIGTQCSGSNSITINVIQPPNLQINGTASVCQGNSTILTASGANTYSWNNGISTNTLMVNTPSANVTYTLTGYNQAGCFTIATKEVTVNPKPTLAISGNTLICLGETSTLSASGASSYSLNGVGSTSNIIISPIINTTYNITGINHQSCSDSIKILVKVSNCTGFAENAIESEAISIYPNPFEKLINIDALLPENSELVVSDLFNTIVYKTVVSTNNEINLGELKSGIYLISITKLGKIIYKKKVIKLP